MDIASKQWVQLTHDGGRNDFPSWAPDGRHIVFQSKPLRQRRNLDDAGRWHQAASADFYGT
jgi:Tol biopolymer transport system component